MFQKIGVIAAGLLIFVSGGVFASQVKDVQVGWVSVWQDTNYSGGGVIRYLPSYSLNKVWSFGVSVDASLLKFASDKNFTAIGYMGFARAKFNKHWSAQLNAGAQTWICDRCNTKFVAGPTVSYDLGIKKAAWINNVWLAYLPVFQDMTANEIQLGLGLQF